MPRLPIISSGSDAETGMPDRLLPAFYMEDYSVLGLRVENFDTAVRLLEKNGISTISSHGRSVLSIEKTDQVPFIIQLLNAHNISCDIADVVERLYQG